MNWWGVAWVEKMQRLAEASRFTEGERCMLRGLVGQIGSDGRSIVARVQVPQEPPYTVRITFDPFTPEQWDSLMAEVRDRKAMAGSLASGDMPLELQTAFSKAKLRFMPERYADLHLECGCSDWLKPCRHLVAVWLRFAREFDREPRWLFRLRGLDRGALETLLLSRRTATVEPVAEDYPEIASPVCPEALPTDPAAFWAAPMLPDAPAESPVRLLLDDDIFERLEDWPGVATQFHQIYDAVYELAGLLLS